MTWEKQSSTNRTKDLSLFIGLAAALFFFCASGYTTYSKTRTVEKNSTWVRHTHDVIIGIDRLLSLLKDAETGQRGYVITGKADYLDPYNAALHEIPPQLDKIQALTQDNPQQQERIPLARNIVESKLQELARVIDVRAKRGLSPATAAIAQDRGKILMDELRDILSTMRQTELDLREKRIKETDKAYNLAITTGIISTLLGIALAIVVTALLRRAAAQRRREEWLQMGRAGLSAAMLGDPALSLLGQNVLKFLSEYLDAHVGMFFAREDKTYKRVATYGLPNVDHAPEYIKNNDGLLGQAVKDARPFIMRNVPDEYIKVGSSLGQSNPRHIVISPAFADGVVNAVFELGFIHPLDDYALTLLEQTSKLIGVAVQSANYRSNLQRLLEETQSQAEELQTQSEELRSSNEELEEQTRNLQESQARLEQQQEELEASNEEMEEKAKALEEQNAKILKQTYELDENRRTIESKAKELELSNKYKSEFLANMSHELRTPLNSLLILARGLAANEDGNLTQEQVEEAQVIHNGGLELLSLINDILDLSKVEAGKLNIVLEDVEPGGIAKKMTRQFEPVAKETHLNFNVNVASDLPATIHTDSQRVEQILKNLLSNAFKFTQEGCVALDIRRDQNKTIVFSVTDTGIGIDESKLKDIFEAFQQEDGSIDRHYGGTGLGLTIARKFARMLGGEIHVSSQKGRGSVFSLILPITATEAEQLSRKDASLPAHVVPANDPEPVKLKDMPRTFIREFIADDRKSITAKDKTLLVVEDDRTFAETLMRIARKRGYKCLAAGDGKSAMLLASELPVSAVILDLKLPDIDGLSVLDQLKHDLHTRHIPVHIITGRENPDALAPLRKGAIGYLTKPVQVEDIDNVFEKIEDLLQSNDKNVLVIEDDKKSQAAILSLLKKKDMDITFATTGEMGLKQVGKKRFDCVVLDLRLPDMTGFDWLEAVEKQTDESNIPPVVVYTAQDLSEEENRRLNRYTGSIVIKGANSSDRLLDEVTLFLHSVESTLSKDQQAVIRMQHDPDKLLQGRTVLLVDDDLRNTFAMSKLLKKRGMNVIVADNGQMALERLREEKDIELVIMDIMMPIMDGYQAMREIRKQKALLDMPIIALTARAMPEEQEKCMEAGANDYLVKPVDIERLLTLIRVWLFKQEVAA